MKWVFQIVPPGSSNSTVTHRKAVKHLRSHRYAAVLMLVLVVSPTFGLVSDIVSPCSYAYYAISPTRKEIKISYNAEVDKVTPLNVSEKLNKLAAVASAVDKRDIVQINATVAVSDLKLVEELLLQANKSRENVEATFELLVESGFVISGDANESYAFGGDAYRKAEELLKDGELEEAIPLALQALQHFGDAFKRVQNVAETYPDKVREEAERAIGLTVAIDRASLFLSRLNVTLRNIADEDVDVSEIEVKLEEAEGSLRSASLSLEAGEIEEAAGKLADVRGILGSVNSPFKKTVKSLKTLKTEQFLTYVERNIEGLQVKITRLQDYIEEERIHVTMVVMQAVGQKVQEIRVNFSEENLEDSIDDLSEVVDEIDKGLSELNGEGISTQLRAINVAEAKVRVLKNTAERLTSKGENTTNVELSLDEVEALMEGIMEQLEEGDTESAQEILDEVEENFDDVQEKILTPRLKSRKEDSITSKHQEEQGDTTNRDTPGSSP